jgi:hypothetical protein
MIYARLLLRNLQAFLSVFAHECLILMRRYHKLTTYEVKNHNDFIAQAKILMEKGDPEQLALAPLQRTRDASQFQQLTPPVHALQDSIVLGSHV